MKKIIFLSISSMLMSACGFIPALPRVSIPEKAGETHLNASLSVATTPGIDANASVNVTKHIGITAGGSVSILPIFSQNKNFDVGLMYSKRLNEKWKMSVNPSWGKGVFSQNVAFYPYYDTEGKVQNRFSCPLNFQYQKNEKLSFGFILNNTLLDWKIDGYAKKGSHQIGEIIKVDGNLYTLEPFAYILYQPKRIGFYYIQGLGKFAATNEFNLHRFQGGIGISFRFAEGKSIKL